MYTFMYIYIYILWHADLAGSLGILLWCLELLICEPKYLKLSQTFIFSSFAGLTWPVCVD